MCGVAGVVGTGSVSYLLYEALCLLQHRGQDSAGIIVHQDGRFRQRKRSGLVRDVFNEEHVARLQGDMGIGHVRYPTAGLEGLAQPLYVNSPYGICMAHNGNLSNAHVLRREMFSNRQRHLNSASDSEVLINVFAEELLAQAQQADDAANVSPEQMFNAVSALHRRCSGAYAVLAMVARHGMLAFRDPYGIRPLIVGCRNAVEGRKYMVASESAALEALGFSVLGDVQPGEAVYIDVAGQMFRRQCAERPECVPCIFEHIYFARPDSVMDGIPIYQTRRRHGERLAQRMRGMGFHQRADCVVPVPDTGRVAAQTIAESLGLRFCEALVKNRYIGRTFIMSNQQERETWVRRKLSAIESEFRDKRVLIVDDSIVRGTTSRQIVRIAREAGAREVYFASAAPPIRYPNVYGIDMPTTDELVAYGRSEEEVRDWLEADALVYQRLDDLIACSASGNPAIRRFECSVFDGRYVSDDVDRPYLMELAQERPAHRGAERIDDDILPDLQEESDAAVKDV